ncbi:M20/M25/M40 family metallo-hydrolase [Aminithiophilus ramosus]|uniref:M20/M25/M40 family metallo-hydrolase n=1 Tax=Aminithiophilus ramosus TaxID=3029084 RepID=A0A9Q7EVH2_9BACT|nr:M20/M25/M40 family metallo-hydrolase [Aminithiophilus ramosus]QTX32453.1 M20/M25/M40 family metallo-hydrolase [Aminithiophilus ramosus]
MTPWGALLADLVATPGVSGHEEAAASLLSRRLPDLGWESVEIDGAGNVVGRRGRGERELLLVGHIDTVPGGPPFRIEGPILWGRGSVDAKGPLCALAAAGGALPLPPGWQVTLVAAVGEERDSRGMRYRLPLHAPAGCVVGEPSGTTGVTIAYRGRLLLELAASDGGAHRSGNSGPLTATVLAAAALIGRVRSLDDPSRLVVDRPSAAVAFMRGDEEAGRSASVEIDVRLPLGADPAAWEADLASVVQNVEVRRLEAVAAHHVGRNDAMARALTSGVRTLGARPALLVKGGTADFNLAAAWNCPLAAYGPGDSRLDHSDEEHLSLDELDRSVAVLRAGLEVFLASRRV